MMWSCGEKNSPEVTRPEERCQAHFASITVTGRITNSVLRCPSLPPVQF